MTYRTFAAMALAGAVLAPTAAYAQATPDIEDAIVRDNRVADSLREQRRTTLLPGQDEGGEIDGEAGVYVLTVNDIFYLGASVGGGWAENPLRTVDDVGDSAFASAAATLGIQTTLAGKVDAGLAVSMSGVEYEESFAPSSRTVNASANLGTPIAGTPFYIGVGAYAGEAFDSGFRNGSGFYGASVSVTGRFPVGQRAVLVGRINGGRQLNQVKENNAWNAVASAELTYVVSEAFTLGVDGTIQRSWYDNFYEDVTFIERLDWQYGGNVNATWSPVPWLGITASTGYSKRDSAFFLSNYDGFEASLIVSARKRF